MKSRSASIPINKLIFFARSLPRYLDDNIPSKYPSRSYADPYTGSSDESTLANSLGRSHSSQPTACNSMNIVVVLAAV